MKTLNQKTTQKTALATALFSLSSLSSVAVAHVGHDLTQHAGASSVDLMAAVTAGLMHPISGLDHVVLAVGMGMVFARHKKLGLGLLVTSLLSGFALVQLPHVAIGSSIIEGAILLSVVLTAAAVLAQRTKLAQANQKIFSLMMAISLFGLTLFHGMAHAVEMPVSSVSQGFGLGMITAMSALFAVGAGVMNWVKAQSHAHPKLSWLPSIMAALGMALVLAN